MDTHYTYFIILAASIAGPFFLSFDKKVAFYKKWKYLFPALLVPAVLYIAWDIYFTAQGVWSFNDQYITGRKLVNLPIEEVLFFLVVPYCCVFIYECIRTYFPQLSNIKWGTGLLLSLAVILLVTGIIYSDRYYTSWSFIFCAVFIILILSFRKFFRNFDPFTFLVSYLVILVPFLIVNGLLTSIPVVLYNDEENLGIRVYTIPFEDIFYGMLLVMMNISIYEKLQPSASR
jgi:lycopene cyclase domain-containing protein